MELRLIRRWFSDDCTIGTLYVGNLWECYTLEDLVREPGVKAPKETAIPYGRYRVVIDWSNRFQRMMPHVLDVPMFSGIRIHAGNTDEDTEGCILVGRERGEECIRLSRMAFNDLFAKIIAARDREEEIWLSVEKEGGG